MKKVILTIIAITALGFVSNAQVEAHAIGARLGGGYYGAGGEVSYQHGMGDANRIEVDFGWSGKSSVNYMSFTGIYHWVFELDGGFNWYAGPGAQFILASANGSSATAFGAGGQLGLEYNFNTNDVPLLLSLDTRPMMNFGNGGSNFGWGVALGVKYTF
jgi:hypothetical protein